MYITKLQHWQKNLVSTGKDIEKEYGIPIVNKRISVTPIALVGSAACKTTDDFVEIAKSLDRAAKEVGVNFLGGYSALVSKGYDKGRGAVNSFNPEGTCRNRACVQLSQYWFNKDRNQYGCSSFKWEVS